MRMAECCTFDEIIKLSAKWAPVLLMQPETGMGYQVATVTLTDGRTFCQTRIVGGFITAIGNSEIIPFAEREIASIMVDHGR